jgi:hypothetical protein
MTPPHFCDNLPFEEDLALFLYKLELDLPKDDLYTVWLRLSSWFWRRFFKIFNVALLFCYYLPLGGSIVLHFNNFECPTLKDNSCHVWFKLAEWFWNRRFLNDPTPFLHFCDNLPFEEDLVLFF